MVARLHSVLSSRNRRLNYEAVDHLSLRKFQQVEMPDNCLMEDKHFHSGMQNTLVVPGKHPRQDRQMDLGDRNASSQSPRQAKR